MQTYVRESRVTAPLEEVWEFHSSVEGLEALTPPWMHLRVESVVGPDGEADPETLETGSRVRLSVRPFDVGPRREWTSEITDRERAGESARFRDVMRRGPFRRWEHTHVFHADGNETIVRDRVAFETSLGAVGDTLAPPFLEGFFRDRHRRTRDQFTP